MPNSDINKKVVFGGTHTFSAEALAYFSYLTVQPSLSQKIRLDQYLFRPLIAAGIFTELDRLWVAASELEQHGTISLVNPSSTALTLVNSPTWTQYQGWDFNGTTQSINTNWAPSAGVNFVQDSASLFTYIRQNNQGTGADIAVSTATTNNSIWARYTDDKCYGSVNNLNASDNYSSADCLGLSSHVRTASNAMDFYRNGVSLGSFATVSSARAAINLYVGARNGSGVTVSFSNREQSVFGVGSGSIDQVALYNIVQSYMTQIGTAV